MYSSGSRSAKEVSSPVALVSVCPYRKANSIYCSASVMTLAISERQDAMYCHTENFDLCPMFLAKILRSN
jgi:hypothetical protein